MTRKVKIVFVSGQVIVACIASLDKLKNKGKEMNTSRLQQHFTLIPGHGYVNTMVTGTTMQKMYKDRIQNK